MILVPKSYQLSVDFKSGTTSGFKMLSRVYYYYNNRVYPESLNGNRVNEIK